MQNGGRRPGSGRKPTSRAVTGAASIRQQLTASTEGAVQHREALRGRFRAWMTPDKLGKLLDRAYVMSERGTASERFRALDLLLRLGLGNPAVWGELSEAGHAGGTDAAASLAQLVSALPPGTALVREGQRGEPTSAVPGDYAPTPPG